VEPDTSLPPVRFSVVVPAYNAADSIASCLNALENQTMPADTYEVIVVDDGSRDRTAEIVKAFSCTYAHQPNRGPAAARNRGAALARGDIILFTDADCIAQENWIEEMVRPFGDTRVTAVKGAYKTKQHSLAARFAQIEFEDRYDLLKRSVSIDMVDTYAAAFNRRVFLDMGGFDENFPVANNEDTDLSYRLATAGHMMLFSPEACVYHTHPDTVIKYLRLKFGRGYWRMIVYRRYPEKAVKDSYTPKAVKIQTLLMALSFPVFLLSLAFPQLFFGVAVLWAGVCLSSVPFALKALQKDFWAGIASPAIIFMRAVVFAAGSLLGVARCLTGGAVGAARP